MSRLVSGHVDKVAVRAILLLILMVLVGTLSEEAFGAGEADPPYAWSIIPVDAPKAFDDMWDRGLAIDNQDHPHLVYGGDHLYHAWFDGGAWQSEVVDDAPGVGGYAQIVIEANGIMHIAYEDSYLEQVRYARNDGSGWQIRFVGAFNDNPNYSEISLAVDSIGRAHVAYVANGLKYARSSGASWDRQTITSSGWYPSIAVDKSNRAYVTYQAGSNWDYQLYYAYQSGSSWYRQLVDSHGWPGQTSSLIIDDNYRPHIAYVDAQYNALHYAYRYSSYWQISEIDNSVSRQTSMKLDSSGNPHICYRDYHDSDFKNQLEHRWKQGGVWHSQEVDPSTRGDCAIALDGNDKVHLAFFTPDPRALKYGRIEGDYLAGHIVDRPGQLDGPVSMALNDLDEAQIAYEESTDYKRSVKHAGRDGADWSIRSISNPGTYPVIALDNEGNSHFAYRVERDLMYGWYEGTAWKTELVATGSSSGADLAIDRNGFPHIVYSDYDTDQLLYRWKDVAGWHTLLVTSSGQAPSLVLDQTSTPHISYYDGRYDYHDLWYAVLDDGNFRKVLVDSYGDSGSYSTIALNNQGLPYISYVEVYPNNTLRLATFDGFSWSTEYVAGTGAYGSANDLVVDADNNVHISFYHADEGALKYARRENGSWQVEVVDDQGDVGRYNSIDIDRAGYVHIAYLDGTNEDLKVAFQHRPSQLALAIWNYTDANQNKLSNAGFVALDVAEVGDYFMEKQERDAVKLIISGTLNAWSLVGVDWGNVKRLPNVRAIPTDPDLLDAYWRTWASGPDDTLARYWMKPLYLARKGNQSLFFSETSWAGLLHLAWMTGEDLLPGEVSGWLGRLYDAKPDDFMMNTAGIPSLELANSYRQYLEDEQASLIRQLSLMNLTAEEEAQYIADLQARQVANDQVLDQLRGHRNLLWDGYQEALSGEANRWKEWGWTLAKWGIIAGATIWWDGPGYYVATVGLNSIDLVKDAIGDSRALAHDKHMVDLSLRFLGSRIFAGYDQLGMNTADGLQMIKHRKNPQIADAVVESIQPQSFGHYRIGWPIDLWWAEEASQVVISIRNDADFPTIFQASAAYEYSSFWTGKELLMVEGESPEIEAKNSGAAIVVLKDNNDGESPEENTLFDILVLGNTDTGIYPVEKTQRLWLPEKIEVPGLQSSHIDTVTAADVPTFPYPLATTTTPLQSYGDYAIEIQVVNPFTLTVAATVTQAIPSGIIFQDMSGGQLIGNDLVWTSVLTPGARLELQPIMHWEGPLGATKVIPAASLAFEDVSTGLGDTYNGRQSEIMGAWPLSVQASVPPTWLSGHAVQIPITMTNEANVEASGTLTFTVETVEGDVLWSHSGPFSLGPGGMHNYVLEPYAATDEPFAVVRGRAGMGTESRNLVLEVITITPQEVYLPLVVR